jgi:hypothetical protein
MLQPNATLSGGKAKANTRHVAYAFGEMATRRGGVAGGARGDRAVAGSPTLVPAHGARVCKGLPCRVRAAPSAGPTPQAVPKTALRVAPPRTRSRDKNTLGNRNNRHIPPIDHFLDLGIDACRRRSWATVEGSVAVPLKGLAPHQRGTLPGVFDEDRGLAGAPTQWEADDGSLTKSCCYLCTWTRLQAGSLESFCPRILGSERSRITPQQPRPTSEPTR